MKELVVRRRKTNEHQCVEWEGLSSLSIKEGLLCAEFIVGAFFISSCRILFLFHRWGNRSSL